MICFKEFIKRATKTHGNKYIYSSDNYKNFNSKTLIICPIHGEFLQAADNHVVLKQGCPKCAKEKVSSSKEQFVEKAKNIHENKYDYSLVNYKNSRTKIIIICPVHGEFEQTPHDHILKKGCYKCGREESKRKGTSTLEVFIEKAKKVHGDKYDYSKVEYLNCETKIIIICPVHGEFEQTPHSHLRYGCCLCKESKGERKIRIFLNENKINFIQQKTFNDCKNINFLPFDFYLLDNNILIEFDGRQHEEEIDYFGGRKRLLEQIKVDNIKNEYAKKENINLIRINYKEDIYEKLYLIRSLIR